MLELFRKWKSSDRPLVKAMKIELWQSAAVIITKYFIVDIVLQLRKLTASLFVDGICTTDSPVLRFEQKSFNLEDEFIRCMFFGLTIAIIKVFVLLEWNNTAHEIRWISANFIVYFTSHTHRIRIFPFSINFVFFVVWFSLVQVNIKIVLFYLLICKAFRFRVVHHNKAFMKVFFLEFINKKKFYKILQNRNSVETGGETIGLREAI